MFAILALGNHRPAVRSGSLPHLDHPVGMLQNPCVMIDDDDGIPIRPQIVHHAGQPLEIMGCKPIDGSSRTYSTPVVRLRTALASCAR